MRFTRFVSSVLLVAFAAHWCGEQAIASEAENRQTVMVVVGAEGEPEFGRQFATWADRIEAAAKEANARFIRIGSGSSENNLADRELLAHAIAAEATSSTDTLWLILIGHGTFDGRVAKFNVRGPDVAASDFSVWLKSISRPFVLVNCTSCSSPFLNELSGANRVIITATRSGNERNFARFGDYFSRAIADAKSDLDKDGQTSALEAYLNASRGVAEFYAEQSRLATEHALLDDNGDGLGTPADWFRGTRATKTAKDGAAADGLRASQLSLVRSEQERRLSPEVREQRDALEFELAKLRDRKSSLDEAVYYQQLEEVLLKLAKLYEHAE